MGKHRLVIGMAVLMWVASATVTLAAPSIQSAVTLGRMHSDMVEAIEEGLAYMIMKDKDEKQDFENKIITFDKLAQKFILEAGLKQANTENLKKEFDHIIQKKGALLQAFHTAFARMEGGQTRMDETLGALEDAIDDFTGKFGPFSKKYFRQTAANLPDKSHEKAVMTLFAMHHDILECIEESFGYLLLGDAEEVEDFSKKLADFREKAREFSAAEYLSKPENAAKRSLFNDMIQSLDGMETAARKMFAGYKSQGAIPMDDVAAYEKTVDALTANYEKLLNQVMLEL